MKQDHIQASLRIDDLLHGGMKIIQDPSAPCFSFDAVALADFARIKPAERVIDLGTGTGILPLLLAAKQRDCQIVGVELMQKMAEIAAQNMVLNGLEAQIAIHHMDIKDTVQHFGKASFQVCISNPPYFKPQSGRTSENLLQLAARSETFCPLPLLLEQVSALLAPLGRFYLIHRASRVAELVHALEAHDLHVEQLRFIQPTPDQNANLVLFAARRCGKGETQVWPPLVVYEAAGKYSKEMERIYGGYVVSSGNANRQSG